jgi:hypothetical protein
MQNTTTRTADISKDNKGKGRLISATYGLKIVKNGPDIEDELKA